MTKDSKNTDTQVNFKAEKVKWNHYCDAIERLRYSALVEEQGFTKDLINDGNDDMFTHICVLNGTEVLGCARYGKSGNVERVAVKKGYRGFKLFRAFLKKVEKELAKDGIDRVWGYVEPKYRVFYSYFGYIPTGQTKNIDKINCVEMEKYINQ